MRRVTTLWAAAGVCLGAAIFPAHAPTSLAAQSQKVC